MSFVSELHGMASRAPGTTVQHSDTVQPAAAHVMPAGLASMPLSSIVQSKAPPSSVPVMSAHVIEPAEVRCGSRYGIRRVIYAVMPPPRYEQSASE